MRTRPLPGCERRPDRHILTNMKVDMTQRYRKFKRTWGTYYAYDNFTGNSVSRIAGTGFAADHKGGSELSHHSVFREFCAELAIES